ncbi:MAG: hypothetical protein HY682_01960, partial [Chloroflexi bacterium]|nr:hypothetical protein [Chloroflexota bacterium]
MAEEQTRSLELDLPELICIEHSLAPSQAASGSDALGLAPSKDTCLKVGAALLEALNSQKPVSVGFTEDELWMMRERLSIYTSQGANTDLGLVIKSKVYYALLSIGNERGAEAVFGIVSTATVEPETDGGISRQEVDDAVRKWEESTGGTAIRESR